MYVGGEAQPLPPVYLEPISKLLEEHGDGGELHNTKKVGGVVLPADQHASLPLEPRTEPFDEPAALIPPQMTPILGFQFAR